MRKSISGRPSLAPLRVKNGDSAPSTSTGRKSSTGGRLSTGSRPSVGGGRLSSGGRASLGIGLSSASTSYGTKIPKYTAPVAKKRRSSGYGRTYGHHEHMKDPRPLSDKSYKEKSIRLLVEFLVEHSYPHNITMKMLQTPQSRDFYRIFEFLYHFIDDKYKIGPKPEEDIPRLFKSLGYPFVISKNHMFAVGTPHTWPLLLAALRWLMDLVKYAISVDIDTILFPAKDDEFDSVPERKLFFNYVEQAYGEFMAGADNYEDLEEELARTLKSKNEGVAGGLEGLAKENERLTRELGDLEQQPDHLLDLKHKLQSAASDEQKFRSYLSELDSHKRQHEQRYTEGEEEHQLLVKEHQALLDNNRKMQQIFDTQEFSPSDVERINMARQELQRQIAAVEKENDALDREIWSLEMRIGKIQENTEAKCAEYNKMAHMMKLIPPTAENAHGRDYEMRPNFHAYGTGDIDFIGSIKPALLQMKKQCNEKVHEAEAMKLRELDSLEQITEMVGYSSEERAMLETEYKHIEEKVECKKEVMQREFQKLQNEMEQIQNDISEMRKKSQGSVEEARNEARDIQKQLDVIRSANEMEEKSYAEFLDSVTKMVVEHKVQIMERVDSLHQHAEVALKEEQKVGQQQD